MLRKCYKKCSSSEFIEGNLDLTKSEVSEKVFHWKICSRNLCRSSDHIKKNNIIILNLTERNSYQNIQFVSSVELYISLVSLK